MSARAAAVVLMMLPTAAMAQDGPSKADFVAASAAGDRLDTGRYLDAAEALRPLAFDAAGKPKPGFVHDQWAELYALMTAEPVDPEPSPAEDAEAKAMAERVAGAILRDAISEIVARAAKTRVVILNENHGLPRDRAFALEVARALRPLGYSVLAAETFMVGDKGVAMSKLTKQGYPTQRTGYYTHDPVFGDFVRQSLALGYRPLSYEQTEEERGKPTGRTESIARREEAQANHLAQALAADPKAKFFVYVGFSHVTEQPIDGPDDAKERWMATRLMAKTGIDPLTIDQTILGPLMGGSNGLARRALAARTVARSVVLFDGEHPMTVGQYAGAVDLQVYHPETRMVKGRPDWLAAMNRRPMVIPAGFVPQKGERLVQAFIAGESDDAIPLDQVLLRAGEDVPSLLVPGDKPLRLVTQDPTSPKP
ncbi:hypothetical protein [Sphingomonas sp. SORGH_AS_0879]|uniref:hypothetical protein n=1 Tax=Sphingomonas sp. SORGH_AS_0879 TaxID=3041790 RepID=UPI002780C7B3|nr:hypothetical protein [Sphingomonas sp. SORGH_AS_0879]MDQ1232186.1 hypothetical protein [Sphingomonas sp. SORGH_AS_0879]